ncbi:UNVERIFIED_CONTAM: hypothetical protein K2H54_062263 [Gekko kuhli]
MVLVETGVKEEELENMEIVNLTWEQIKKNLVQEIQSAVAFENLLEKLHSLVDLKNGKESVQEQQRRKPKLSKRKTKRGVKRTGKNSKSLKIMKSRGEKLEAEPSET